VFDYFFSGNEYIRVTRGETGPGTVDPGYPAAISNWGWGAFGAHGIDAALYSGSKCYFFSGNQYIRVTRGETGAGTVDPGYPAPISNWGWGAFGARGIKAALSSLGAYASPPSSLGSNSNYFLTNCDNITGLTVDIYIDDAMTSDIGFGFQLNAYSATHDDADAAQQYVLMFDGTSLWGWVDNWTSSNTEVVNDREVVTTFHNNAIPAGTRLQIALADDSSDRVTAATFTAWDHTGRQLGSLTLALKSLKKDNGQAVTDADLAPINAFQLDLVGPYNGKSANLTGGQGTFTYTANVDLGVANTEPPCVDWDYSTLEQANSSYSEIQSAIHSQHYQYFVRSAVGVGAARVARVGHKLVPPA
jgi:hypothetical protein